MKDNAQKIFFFSFAGRVPVIFWWISEGLCKSSFFEEIFNIKDWKTRSTFFLQFYERPGLGNKLFTTWNVLNWEVYLNCINFWKFDDYLKACLELIRVWSWPKNVKRNVKIFYTFDPLRNLKFNFPERGPVSVHIPPKAIFLLKFSKF